MQHTDEPPRPAQAPFTHGAHRYYRAPNPVHFPEQEPEHEKVPEGKQHLELRTLLYQVLKLAFGDRHSIGCDQFVYWDPTDPRRCQAPDAFLRRDGANDLFGVWKVWERGAPHIAIEVVSPTERHVKLEDQLAGYRQMGVAEFIRFDCEDDVRPLRVWDRIDDDLVERALPIATEAPSTQLGVDWVVTLEPQLGPALRPRDRQTGRLLPTAAERAEAEAEHHRRSAASALQRADAERERADAERERADAAERRIRELEKLSRR